MRLYGKAALMLHHLYEITLRMVECFKKQKQNWPFSVTALVNYKYSLFGWFLCLFVLRVCFLGYRVTKIISQKKGPKYLNTKR